MQSKATSVEAFLAELPPDRRATVEALRGVIRKNLDKDYEEGMQYGMIGYYVPHRVFPAGYHCDPRQPLPFAGIGSQKNHVSLYLGCVYGSPGEAEWFQKAWADEVAKGKATKLDMGKACVRVKKLEDVPLNVIGQVIKRTPARKYIAQYEATLAGRGGKTVRRGGTDAERPARSAGAAKKSTATKKPAARAKVSRAGAKKSSRS